MAKQSVGTCECPIKGCTEVLPVFKYEGRSDDPKKRRFAGRMFTICPQHGRVENQEFILCNAKLENPKNEGKDASGASSENASPREPTQQKPQQQPKQQPAQPKKSGWFDNWGPIIK